MIEDVGMTKPKQCMQTQGWDGVNTGFLINVKTVKCVLPQQKLNTPLPCTPT